MPRNMLSVAAKKRGTVTLRDVVSMAMVMALRNMTTKMTILNALVCEGNRKTRVDRANLDTRVEINL